MTADFKNSAILITGGLGFVGLAIAQRLLTEQLGPVVLFDCRDHLPPAFLSAEQEGRIRVVKGDIRNAADVQRAMEGCRYVFHEAAIRVTKCAKEPRLAHEIMGDGTFNVIDACLANKVKKIIFASTAVVYGDPLELPLKESHPLHDTTLYGVLKTFGEHLLRFYHQQFGLDYAILRYFNVYGRGMNLFGPEIEVLIRWLDRIDQGLAPLIFGDGKQTLDYVHIGDVAEANWKALQPGVSAEAFNVCTGRETSILELLEVLLRLKSSKLEPEFHEARTVNQVPRRFGDPAKARAGLDFHAQVPLEEGLRDLIEWRESVRLPL